MDEFIIVGGGLAGLSAAFRLTRAGKLVRLLEARLLRQR
jgi:phytoene dehydrogenase-like protein